LEGFFSFFSKNIKLQFVFFSYLQPKIRALLNTTEI
jgi:hypothetical protein